MVWVELWLDSRAALVRDRALQMSNRILIVDDSHSFEICYENALNRNPDGKFVARREMGKRQSKKLKKLDRI